ncbi:hypothetical protein HY389_02295 [Candidatus Daviesbacteria bacterium]|nr:hypothetical protein [Candidatus Daviesbacteria bacterium]
MRESRLYLSFLKDNLWLIFIPSVVVGLGAYAYQLKQPPKFHTSQLLQMDYNDKNIQDRIVLTDEAVTQIRSANLQGQLKVGTGERVNLFKPGPLSINLEVISGSKDRNLADISQINQFASAKFPLKTVGETVTIITKTPEVIFGLVGTTLGFALGILISLIRTYWRKF